MAVTGKGDHPIRSVWLVDPSQLRRGIRPSDSDDAEKNVWTDWFFAASGATTQTGTLTAGAVVKKTQSASLTANAVVKRTQSGSLTANAVIRQTKTGTFTANAVTKRTQTGTISAAAVIKRTITVPKPITSAFVCGFECATISTDWSVYGNAVFDSTVVGRTGTNAARMDVNATTSALLVSGGDTGPIQVARLRFRVSALPTGAVSIFKFNGAANYDAAIILWDDGSLEYVAGAGTATSYPSPLIVPDQWYTLQFWVDATAHASGWMIDRVAMPTPGAASVDETFNSFYAGSPATNRGPFSLYVDDVVVSNTLSDYPIPDGYVNASDAWVSYLTLDAIIVAGASTQTGSFTANAVIRRGQSGSFTANAVIKRTQTGSFTANAAIKRGQTGSFTAAAVLSKNSGTKTFTADAIRRTTPTGSLTANAVLKRGQTGSLTASAVVKATSSTKTFTADAAIKRTQAGSSTANAVLRKTQSGSLTASALVRLAQSGSLTANAAIGKGVSSSLTADAVLVAGITEQTGSFTASAIIRLTGAPPAITASAILLKTISHVFDPAYFDPAYFAVALSADAIKRRTYIFGTDWVEGGWTDPNLTGGQGITADAVIVAGGASTESGSFTADAIISAGRSGTLTASALIQKTSTGTFTASAVIKKVVAPTFTAAANIKGTVAASTTVDAIQLRTFWFGRVEDGF
jgi:hypothetical protein